MDHVSDYKPPQDNDKLDDETRQLQTEGCAPKLQLTSDQIKREHSQGDVVQLPKRLPIMDVKREKSNQQVIWHLTI